MQVKQLLKILEKFAPPKYAESWDKIGLIVGKPLAKISGILVALDVTQATLNEALQLKCNVIVSHHPLFTPIKKNINVISLHTNLDSTRHGLNDLLAKKIGLTKLKPLIPNKLKPRVGLGRVGKLAKNTDLKSFAQYVGRQLGIKHLTLVGPANKKISKVAVMTGSGGNFVNEAKAAGADVLVTGDVKYHHALDALAMNIAVIDAGHYGTEIGMIELITQLLKKLRVKSTIYASRCHKSPFKPLDIK